MSQCILSDELQLELILDHKARCEKKLKRARSDYMIDFWQERIDKLNAAQQRLHLTGGESAPLQALSTSEHGSGLEADTTPPTASKANR